MTLESKRDRAPHAARMRHLRLLHGLTHEECGAALGVDYSTYAAMEANRVRFRRRDLVTLADLYQMPLDEAFPAHTAASKASA